MSGEAARGSVTLGTRLDKLRSENKRLLGLVLIGPVAGCLVIDTIWITAMPVWGLPDDEWWRLTLGTLFGFGFMNEVFRLASWRQFEEGPASRRPRLSQSAERFGFRASLVGSSPARATNRG